MRAFRLISTLCVLAAAWPACAAEIFQGKVVKIFDCDKIDVMHNGKQERIRLAGVSCPKEGQPFHQTAKGFAASLAAGLTVTVKPLKVDKKGRTVGEVTLPDGRSLGRELLEYGCAWWNKKTSTDPAMKEVEQRARRSQRGLWSEPNPVPPWEFRKKKCRNRH